MSISIAEARAAELTFDSDNLIVHFTDGRVLYVPLTYFPRLLNATPEERDRYEISGGGTGLHWESIDEDISVKGLLLGIGDLTRGTGLT